MIKILWQKYWLRRTFISLVVVLILLTALPFVIQLVAVSQIKKLGADKVEISNIDLNLFSGRFKLEQLEIQNKNNPPLKIPLISVDLAMMELFQSRIVVEDVEFKGLEILVERDQNNEIIFNGISLPKSKLKAEPVAAEKQSTELPKFALLNARISDSKVDYKEPGFSTQIEDFNLIISNLISWQPESKTDIKLNAKINDAPLEIDSQLQAFAESPSIIAEVSLQQLALKTFQKFSDPYIQQLEAKISLDSRIEARLGDKVQVSATSELNIEQLKFDYEALQPSTQLIQFKGDVSFDEGSNQTSLQGDLNIGQLKFDYKMLQHSTQSIQFKGTGSFDGGTNEINLNGGLNIDQSKSTIDEDFQLLVFDRLAVKDIQFSGDELGISKVDLVDFDFSHNKDQKSLTQWKNLSLNNVRFELENNNLKIEKVELAKPQATITITKEGTLEELDQLLLQLAKLKNKEKGNKDKSVSDDSVDSAPFKFLLNKLMLTEAGKIHFRDHKIQPNYDSEFVIDQLTLGPIGPEQVSDINILLKQGEFSSIDVSGSGLLLKPEQQMDLTTKITRLELPQISSYSTKAIGYGLKSGVLDSEIQLKLDHDKIDSNVKFELDHLDIVETDKKTAEQMASAAGMSINLAISTLKDDNQIIELELPIQGDIHEPDFDLTKVFNKALGIAMKSASFSYLKHILQPFGTLLTVYDLVDDVANRVSLAPVIFEANSLNLKPDQKDLFDKIQTLMNERPELKLKTCGISNLLDQQSRQTALTEKEKKLQVEKLKKAGKDSATTKIIITIDQKEVQSQLLQLADKRSEKIKSKLVKQQGIDADRILGCLSEIKTGKDDLAAVILTI